MVGGRCVLVPLLGVLGLEIQQWERGRTRERGKMASHFQNMGVLCPGVLRQKSACRTWVLSAVIKSKR